MVNKLLETISATFMLTAAAYAAGVVQSKELYRELGVEPELVSIDFQKALYDGGLLVFSELAKYFRFLIPYISGLFALAALACLFKWVRRRVVTNGAALIKCLAVVGYFMVLWLIYDVTVDSFGRGRNMGSKLAAHLKAQCTLTSVKLENGTSSGLCAVGRSADLLWFYDPKTGNSVAFGKDKIIKVVSGG